MSTPIELQSPSFQALKSTQASSIAVAMSGGVDSSVAAALFLEQKIPIFGLTMVSCEAHLPAAEAAAQVCSALGITHIVVDLKTAFQTHVVDPFVAEYLAGRTPTPCVHCNRTVKFGALWQAAQFLGAKQLVTGHYARLLNENGQNRLHEGIDTRKDQSYFLYAVDPETLNHLAFPLGAMTKAEVRAYAHDHALPVAETPDSEDICFIPDGDYAGFVERNAPMGFKSGPICTLDGKILGEHRGQHRYTIGQRKGLGIASTERLYVIEKRGDQVILGPGSAVYSHTLKTSPCVWHQKIDHPFQARVRIRSTDRGALAQVTPLPDKSALVEFASPAHAVAPGQAAVFYNDQCVLGGGIILSNQRMPSHDVSAFTQPLS